MSSTKVHIRYHGVEAHKEIAVTDSNCPHWESLLPNLSHRPVEPGYFLVEEGGVCVGVPTYRYRDTFANNTRVAVHRALAEWFPILWEQPEVCRREFVIPKSVTVYSSGGYFLTPELTTVKCELPSFAQRDPFPPRPDGYRIFGHFLSHGIVASNPLHYPELPPIFFCIIIRSIGDLDDIEDKGSSVLRLLNTFLRMWGINE